jgi:hypothetical protein
MTKTDIIAAALAGGFSAPFRAALKLTLDWECVLNHVTGEIEWENVDGDSGGKTFAGLLLKDGEITENPIKVIGKNWMGFLFLCSKWFSLWE